MAERRWNLFWACMVAAAGLVIAAQTIGTVWAIVGMSIAAIGFYGSKGSFWAMPSMILTGTAAASGIAWINSVGSLGGFFGPTAVGWAKDYTGGFQVVCMRWLALQSCRPSFPRWGCAFQIPRPDKRLRQCRPNKAGISFIERDCTKGRWRDAG